MENALNSAASIANSTVIFRNMVFRDNIGQRGSAISSTRSSITIQTSQFQHNLAQQLGAAIYAFNSDIQIQR